MIFACVGNRCYKKKWKWHISKRELHICLNHLGVSGDWWAGVVLGGSGPTDPSFCSSISLSKQASFHPFIFGLKKVLSFVNLGWALKLREVSHAKTFSPQQIIYINKLLVQYTDNIIIFYIIPFFFFLENVIHIL